jgi:hypothetical protein
MPGWLEADLDNGWSPPTEYAYREDTGHIVGIEEPDENNHSATDAAGRLKPPPAPPMRSQPQEPEDQPVLQRKPRRPRAPEPAPEPLPSRMLVLTIQRSGDADRDQRKLKRLHGKLMQYPGSDRFCFIIEGGGKKKSRMDFPNNSIGINDEILDFACKQLGEENVRIEE